MPYGYDRADAALEEKEYWADVRDTFKKVRDFCKNFEDCRGCPLRRDEESHQCTMCTPASWEIEEDEEEEEE